MHNIFDKKGPLKVFEDEFKLFFFGLTRLKTIFYCQEGTYEKNFFAFLLVLPAVRRALILFCRPVKPWLRFMG